MSGVCVCVSPAVVWPPLPLPLPGQWRTGTAAGQGPVLHPSCVGERERNSCQERGCVNVRLANETVGHAGVFEDMH